MNGQIQGLDRCSAISAGTREVTAREQGTAADTGQIHDLAINEDGFSMIQETDGQYPTYDGYFDRDGESNPVLPGVGQIMGDGGPVYADEGRLYVGLDGIVYNNEDGTLGQIQIVVPGSYDGLIFYDSGACGAGNAMALEQAYPTVYQGKLETSEVDLNSEMTRTMEIWKTF